MPDARLHGLALTHSERIIVVALAYIFVGPVVWSTSKRLLQASQAPSPEARQRILEEQREDRRRRRRLRDRQP